MKTFSLITLSQAEVYQHLQAALAADGVDVDLENLSLEVDAHSGSFVVQAHNVRVRPATPAPSLIVPAMSLADARREAAAAPAQAPRPARPSQPVAQNQPRRPFVPVPTAEELGPPVEFDLNKPNGRAPLGPPPSSEEVNSLTPPPRRHVPAVEQEDGEPDHEDLVRANRQLRASPAYNRPVRGGTIETMGRNESDS